MRLIAVVLLASVTGATPAQSQSLRLLGDLNTSPPPPFLPGPATLGVSGTSTAYFAFSHTTGSTDVWRTDGTPAGTMLVADLIPSRPNIIGAAGDTIVFESGGMVVASPRVGEAVALPVPVTVPTRPSIDFWLPHAARDESLFFESRAGGNIAAFAVTDGTAAGTRLLSPATYASFVSFGATRTRAFACGLVSGGDSALLCSNGADSPAAVVVRTFPTGNSTNGIRFGWLTPWGDRVVFIASDTTGRRQLWISDGTDAGTTPLTTFASSFTKFLSPVTMGNRIAFLGPLGMPGQGAGEYLWLSDGTAATTRRAEVPFRFLVGAPATEPVPESPRSPLVSLNGALGMIVMGGPKQQPPHQLAFGDGSIAGTALLDLGSADPIQFIGVTRSEGGDVAYFTALDGAVANVWRTDGTPGGTFRLANVPASPAGIAGITALSTVGNRFVFGVREHAVAHAWRVWVSDGSVGGSQQIAGLGMHGPSNGSSNPANFTRFQGSVLFGADTSAGFERYRATASPNSAVPCEESVPGDDGNLTPSFVVLNGRLFSHVTRPVKTPEGSASRDALVVTDDASVLGEVLYQSPGVERIRDLSPMGGVLYFGAALDESSDDNTLWRSDGTAQGTAPVVPPGEGPPINPASPVFEWEGRGYFIAEDVTRVGFALWSTDGTPAGTQQLALLLNSFPLARPEFRVASSRLYFNAHGPDAVENRLWTSDGTPEGTRVVDLSVRVTQPGLASAMAVLDDRLIVSGTQGTSGVFLWTPNTDATALVGIPSTLTAGPISLTTVPTAAGHRVMFTGGNASTGSEPWVTDGTSEGTVMVADMWPGTFSSSPSDFTAGDGRVYFSAYTGPTGREMWETDGSAEGTRLVADIAPGPWSSLPGRPLHDAGVLYFGAVGPLGREPYAVRLVPCAADFTADDRVTSDDFFQFLACFFTPSCGAADFNGDGEAGSQDFFDFLGAFFSGCE